MLSDQKLEIIYKLKFREHIFWSFHWIIKLAPEASHKNKHEHTRIPYMQTWRNESVRKYKPWIKYRLIWCILSVRQILKWTNEWMSIQSSSSSTWISYRWCESQHGHALLAQATCTLYSDRKISTSIVFFIHITYWYPMV